MKMLWDASCLFWERERPRALVLYFASNRVQTRYPQQTCRHLKNNLETLKASVQDICLALACFLSCTRWVGCLAYLGLVLGGGPGHGLCRNVPLCCPAGPRNGWIAQFAGEALGHSLRKWNAFHLHVQPCVHNF